MNSPLLKVFHFKWVSFKSRAHDQMGWWVLNSCTGNWASNWVTSPHSCHWAGTYPAPIWVHQLNVSWPGSDFSPLRVIKITVGLKLCIFAPMVGFVTRHMTSVVCVSPSPPSNASTGVASFSFLGFHRISDLAWQLGRCRWHKEEKSWGLFVREHLPREKNCFFWALLKLPPPSFEQLSQLWL